MISSVYVLLNISNAKFKSLLTFKSDNNYFDSSSPLPCVKNEHSVFHLMAVPSRADHLRERMAIRNSWGSVVKRYTSLPLIFFVGKKVDQKIKDTLAMKKETYMNMIELYIMEKYKNLVNKINGFTSIVKTPNIFLK